MSLRTLPAAPTARSADVRSNAPDKALARWVPGLAPRQVAGDEAERSISILDVIGEDFWLGEGVTSKRIGAALRQIGERDVIVNVNSPGGDFFEGLAIYNMLREHPAKVTVRIVGLAASAAATIAMAGDEVLIAKAGFMMVHETLWCACGHADELREVASIMDTFDEVAVGIVADRAGMTVEEAGALLKGSGDGTWLSGKRAVELGLADGHLPADLAVAAADDRPAQTAIRRISAALRRDGMSRGQERETIQQLKTAMQDAGPDGTQDAAVERGLDRLLTKARNMEGAQHAV